MQILDAHCHIYPEKIAARAVESVGAFYDLKMHRDGTVQCLLENGEKAGITHYLVHSVSTTPHQVQSINRFISEQVVLSNGKMTGFGSLHPDSPDMEGDLAHLLSLGLKGVKLHPDVQAFAIDSKKSIDMCRNFAGRVPLLVHAGDPRYDFSNPEQLFRFMEALPEMTVIAAHFGGWDNWQKAMEILPGTPNLYVDTSSSFYAIQPDFACKMIEAYGPDHVLFGSDYPMWPVSGELNYLDKLGLDEKEKRMILWENGARLLDLR